MAKYRIVAVSSDITNISYYITQVKYWWLGGWKNIKHKGDWCWLTEERAKKIADMHAKGHLTPKDKYIDYIPKV